MPRIVAGPERHRAQRVVVRHAERHGVARFVLDVARVERFLIAAARVADERHLDARAAKHGRILLALTERVERIGDVVHRAGDHRHVRRREPRRDLPRFGAAQDHEPNVLAFREAHHRVDVIEPVHGHEQRLAAFDDVEHRFKRAV